MKYNLLLLSIFLIGCSSNPTPQPGPDKQGEGMLRGLAIGAGAGAVTGAQIAAATGPGALIGAGFGAVAGSITGMFQDSIEEQELEMAERVKEQRKLAMVHEALQDHYSRRITLHPTRDIFPADLFFEGDSVELSEFSRALVEEIGKMNEYRMPWSRIAVVTYSRANNEDSDYAMYLAQNRSKTISNLLIRAGIEPRRIESIGMVVDAPILIDPSDVPGRYNQAIEFTLLDR